MVALEAKDPDQVKRLYDIALANGGSAATTGTVKDSQTGQEVPSVLLEPQAIWLRWSLRAIPMASTRPVAGMRMPNSSPPRRHRKSVGRSLSNTNPTIRSMAR